MTAASPRSDRWLWGPVPDLLLGCGLLYALAFAVLAIAGPQIRVHQALFVFPLLILLVSTPHYGATLVRVYEQRAERRRYYLFSVWLSLGVLGLFFTALFLPWVASICVTVLFTWSPYHYMGQNYGIASLFLRKRNIEVSGNLRRVLKASFFLSFAMIVVSMNIDGGQPVATPRGYTAPKLEFLSLDIPAWTFFAVSALYLATLAGALILLRRAAPMRDLGPTLMLILSQALWFSLPLAAIRFGWFPGIEVLHLKERAYYFIWIGLAHGIQYLWITSYFARSSKPWSGVSSYWAKTVLAGTSIWTLPVLLLAPIGLGGFLPVADYAPGYEAGFALIVAASVNIHHFMLDGVIWRLRNQRIASILLRSDESSAAEDTNAEPRTRRWLPKTIWTLAGASLVTSILVVWAQGCAFPRDLEQGNWRGAETTFRTLDWLGYASPQNRIQVGAAAYDAGDTDDSVRLFQEAVANQPGLSNAHYGLGRALEARGEIEGGIRQYFEALEVQPGFAEAHFSLANALAKRNRLDAAIMHYRAAIRSDPRRVSAYNNLAAALASTGDRHAALETYRKALEIDPSNPTASRSIENLEGTLR